MKIWRVARLPLLVGLWASLSIPQLAVADKPHKLLRRDWLEAKTANFTIISSVSEHRTTKLIESLELLRQVVLKTTTATTDASPIPTKIFAISQATLGHFCNQNNCLTPCGACG